MGDMADSFLNDVIDHECDILRYRTGRMGDEEAYDLGIIESDGAILNSGYKHKSKSSEDRNE